MNWDHFKKMHDITEPTVRDAFVFTVNRERFFPHLKISEVIDIFFKTFTPSDFRRYLNKYIRHKKTNISDLINEVPNLKESTLTVLAFIAEKEKTR